MISDHVRDYCCRIGGLGFQHLDADFPTSETCFTVDKFKRRRSKSLFWREQLNGEKVKREWLCYLPLSEKLYCFVCKLFAFDSEKSCWNQLVVASGSMHHATWPGRNLPTNT